MNRQSTCDSAQLQSTSHSLRYGVQWIPRRGYPMSEATELTTKETAAILGIGQAMVRWFVRNGELHPRKLGGAFLFEEREVRSLAARYKPNPARQGRRKVAASPKNTVAIARGKFAAACFACFDRGLNFRETVVATKCSPELVREFWRTYHESFEQAAARERAAKDEAKARQLERERAQQRRYDERKAWMKFQADMSERAYQRAKIQSASTHAATDLVPLPLWGSETEPLER